MGPAAAGPAAPAAPAARIAPAGAVPPEKLADPLHVSASPALLPRCCRDRAAAVQMRTRTAAGRALLAAVRVGDGACAAVALGHLGPLPAPWLRAALCGAAAGGDAAALLPALIAAAKGAGAEGAAALSGEPAAEDYERLPQGRYQPDSATAATPRRAATARD
eukprot:gene18452-41933_t